MLMPGTTERISNQGSPRLVLALSFGQHRQRGLRTPFVRTRAIQVRPGPGLQTSKHLPRTAFVT